jgi:gliding motility-associated lipoprotein GldH
MRRFNFLSFCALIAVLFSLTSCDSHRVYEKNIGIPDYMWKSKTQVEFETMVSDTISLHNVYVNVRNASQYPYRNLFLFLETHYPDGKYSRDTLECILADESGKWLGDGSGDIWDNRFIFKKNVRFPVSGTYKFYLEHAMRNDPLPMIMDVGIRIEKAE